LAAENTLYALVVGFAAGTVATTIMTILQLPFYRMWGLVEKLEWHENVCILARIFGNNRPERLIVWSFLLHYLLGEMSIHIK
jgi:hypothetical protein